VHAICGRKAHRNLYWRIRYDDILPNDVPLDARDEHDSIGVASNSVVLDHVVVGAGRHEANAEVTALGCVSVAAQPVPPEPTCRWPTQRTSPSRGASRTRTRRSRSSENATRQG